MRPKVQIVTVSLPSTEGGGDDIFPALQKAYEAANILRKVKALIVTNPGNPTSTCLSDTSMRECMRFCRDNGLHLIVDEIYALATIQGSSSGRQGFRSALSLLDASSGTERWIDPAQVHVVWSASKLFGLCGPRIVSTASSQRRKRLMELGLYDFAKQPGFACCGFIIGIRKRFRY